MTEFSELPAPPQEKSGESKVPQEQERKSIFRWLRDRGLLIYMTAALSVATPFKHERLEAADIPLGATWMEGIQTLRNGVLSDKIETLGTFYIDNQTQRGKWIFGKEGEPSEVKYAPKDIKDAVEAELSAAPTQSVTVCELHTHPLSAGESESVISEEDSRNVREGKHSVSLPPSGDAMRGDIGLPNMRKLEAAFDKFREKGVTVEVRQGVVDAAGITYHRPIEDRDLKQEFPEYFSELEQRKSIVRKWEKSVNSAVENIDTETVNKLHDAIPIPDDRYIQIYKGPYSQQEKTAFKRQELKERLIDGSMENMAWILFAGNSETQKLQKDYMTLVVDKATHDRAFIDEAYLNWVETSMTVAPEQLPAMNTYTKLREAYARNAAYIRFVPHEKLADEPPCSGTDYKP